MSPGARNLLTLQRLVGNKAVTKMVQQRPVVVTQRQSHRIPAYGEPVRSDPTPALGPLDNLIPGAQEYKTRGRRHVRDSRLCGSRNSRCLPICLLAVTNAGDFDIVAVIAEEDAVVENPDGDGLLDAANIGLSLVSPNDLFGH